MKTIFFLIGIFITPAFLLSQSKLGNEWITGGGGAKIKFINNSIVTSSNVFYNTYFHMGNSSICDTNGNMILCSDGYNVYNNAGSFLDGGDTLIPLDFYVDQDGSSVMLTLN